MKRLSFLATFFALSSTLLPSAFASTSTTLCAATPLENPRNLVALAPRAASPLPSGWTQKGCYVDATQPDRALTSFNLTSTSLTPNSCATKCSGMGYSYAGVEHGEQCFCGNTIQTGSAGEGAPASTSDCNMACTGDSSQTCGGNWRLMIYQDTTPVTLPSGWSLKGCYVDAAYPNRALVSFNTTSTSDTPTQCINTCTSKGYAFAGVENGNECYCSNTIETGSTGEGAPASITDCNIPCNGDANQACGGGWRVMIYSFSGTVSTTSSSSTSTRTTTSSMTTSTRTTTTTTTTTTSSSSSSSSGADPTGAVIHPGASASKCLTASSNANNAAVEIEDCNGSAGQSWTLVGGTLQTFTNKCLDVTSGSTTNGNKMQIYTCSSGNANQQFTTTGNTIAWTGKGECLDLTDGSLTNGNVIQMWTCTGGQNQVWNIVNGSTPPPPTSTTSRTSSTSTTSSITSTTTTSTTTSTTSSSSRSTTTTSTSATPTWSSKGCYVDAAWPNRALTGSNATLTNDTPALCQSTCASQGFQYAGVEHGNQCFCGNSLQVNTGGAGEGVSVDSTDCQMACAGDANQFCGGTSWRIFIYQLTTGGPTSTSSVSSTTTTTSAGSGSTLPALWSSKGCYVDAAAPNRALGSYSVDSDSNTPTQCINTCFGQGFIFAGVEFSDECYCANSIHASGGAGVLAAASDCNMPCAGDSSQNCGAGWRLQIYSYSGTPPSTSTATATISVSTPTSAVKISQNHFSFSIELDRWPDWTGTSSQNTFYFNVLNNLKGITGQPPKIRVGGNSEDNAQYSTSVQYNSDTFPAFDSTTPYPEASSITVGPAFYTLGKWLPSGTHMTFGVNLGGNTVSTAVNQAQAIMTAFQSSALVNAGITLDYIEIGNEADLYGGNGHRTGTWNIGTYMTNWESFATSVSQAIGLTPGGTPSLLGASFGLSDNGAGGFSPQELFSRGLLSTTPGKLINTISQHHYSGSFCSGNGDLLQNLMTKDTIRGNLTQFLPDIQATHAQGLEYIFGETNSYSCHGAPGVSNVAGAALWALDYGLQIATLSVPQAYFHEGIGFKYNFVQPIALNRSITTGASTANMPAHVQPSYYAAIIAAEATGSTGTTKIAEIIVPDPRLAGYGFWEGSTLKRAVFINSLAYTTTSGSRTSKHISLAFSGSGAPTTMTVKRLAIGHADDTSGVSWGGQTYETSNGLVSGSLSVSTVPVSNGFDIAATEAVLLTF